MNEHKIAFIMCMNDADEYAECLYYLDRLEIPEGYERDIIAVQEAPAMTSGYQAAMKESDAKYKVYLHQDVFILNRGFLRDILDIFQADAQIGLIGCVGTTGLDRYARAVTDWNTGKVWHNCTPSLLSYDMAEPWRQVEAVDGFLMATQYDLPWREDLFDGWDYYDISQCMEMRRAGYQCVVPHQREPWCLHDNSYSKMSRYYEYAARFAREYQDIQEFQSAQVSDEIKKFAAIQQQLRSDIKLMIDMGERTRLIALFQKPENCGFLYLKEYQTIAEIEDIEKRHQVPEEIRLWKAADEEQDVVARLRRLKHMLYRRRFCSPKKTAEDMPDLQEYSEYAVRHMNARYELTLKEQENGIS